MRTFRLIISNWDKTIFNGNAEYCGVTTQVGNIGIEARHEAMAAILAENSEIIYRNENGDEATFPVQSGMLSFENNRCVITVERGN